MSNQIKFTKIKNIFEVSNFNADMLAEIFKIDVPCMIAFKSVDELQTEKYHEYVILHERTYSGNVNKIQISTKDFDDKNVSYNDLFDIVGKYGSNFHITIHISVKEFNRIQPLLTLLGNIKKSFIDTVVKLTYVDAVFGVICRPKNNLPDEFYYFDDNDSILMFNETGPKLIIGKTNSVDDILCN